MASGEKYTIYKVVRETNNPNDFTSFVVFDKHRLHYRIDEMTTSTTPIFVFSTQYCAELYKEHSRNTAILEGYSINTPIWPRFNIALDIVYQQYTTDEIRAFWFDYLALDKKDFSHKYATKLVGMAAFTQLVYDFTPVRRIV